MIRYVLGTAIAALAILLGRAGAQGTDEAPFLELRVGEETGQLLVLLPEPDEDGTALRAIHATRLASGLGSNPLGLDRGYGTSGEIVRFRVRGDRVTAEVENHRYRAETDNQAERSAVAQSFARSIVWSGKVLERTEDGVLVDLTGYFASDAMALAAALKEDETGDFALDADRSSVLAEEALAFPDNIEVDAELTFTSDDPGAEVSATTPDPRFVTLTVHHTLARLPGPGYAPRLADRRLGTFTYGFYDFAAPLEGAVATGYAVRHRLMRSDPDDPESAALEPIVFHVDPGAPDAIRAALIDGASWWQEAFAAAGFPDGYRVEVLPDGAHPLDIRYNVIQWVHRQTRGWSYGGGVVDPRTGEMLKGHVILGSQRVRQDRMIFEGLAGTEKTGTGADDDPVELSLDRIRQLAAHETAHALGFGHNFAASANDRASVADYPAPWVIAREDGTLDFSKAYAEGMGAWDLIAARWLYGDYGAEEAAALDEIVQEAREVGLLFVEDGGGRGAETAHPLASVWDNGSDPVAELRNVLRVRQIALERFGADRAASGAPAARLREVLVPIYLYHRYQTAAAAKSIGGVAYQYAKLGRDPLETEIVPPDRQREALAAVLRTLDPAALALPEALLSALVPPASEPWYAMRPETFDGAAGEAFDPYAAAATAADITLGALLAPERLERLAQFHARNDDYPSVDEVLTETESIVFRSPNDPNTAAIARTVAGRYVAALIGLDGEDVSDRVGAVLRDHLAALEDDLGKRRRDPHAALLASRIEAHLSAPAPERQPVTPGPETPPGSPIGGSTDWLGSE